MPTTTKTQLLISVQNTQEALLAHQAGADIIDLKNPKHGALGKVSDQILHQTLNHAQLKNTLISTANGDLNDNQPKISHPQITYYKLGLTANQADPHWQSKLTAWHQNQLHKAVAVAFADYQRSASPNPNHILDWAIQNKAAGFLIDTAIKDGKGLLHWITPQTLAILISRASNANLFVALAGSLRINDIPTCLKLNPQIIGVRGAACKNTDRQSNLCPHQIAQLITTCRKSN